MKPVSFASVLLLSTGLFTTLGLLGSGCGGKSDGPSSGGAPTPVAQTPLPEPPYVAKCEPGVHGGRLVVATFGDPKTFNPITANEASSTDIIRFLFMGLVNMDMPSQEIIPALAHKWSVLPDNKTWTFELRKGLKWSDGKPLTADDVVFTWDVIYNPDIINVTADLFRIDGKNFKVTKIDDLTIQVVTPEPYAPFVEFFGQIPIIPKHILNRSVAEKSFVSAYGISTPPDQLVGSGPFRVKQFKPGEFTLMERNPYFWGVDSKGQRL
ncbi:MAG TPA: ABC transporter substrate-binding protein, partial [Roseimicrobium sp.]|nr:ABC transporter substrate-binding protein [Roseimicrobium sp.]